MWRLFRSLLVAPPFHAEDVRECPEEVRERPEDFAGSGPPDWLLEWGGMVLPGGGGYKGRLPLWQPGIRSTAEVLYPLSRLSPAQPKAVELLEPAASRLWSILREAFPGRLLSMPQRCCDGFPFEVVVYRREPYRGVRARCNLGDGLDWLPPVSPGVSARVPPVFRLGFLLLELSLAGGDKPAEPGATAGRPRA